MTKKILKLKLNIEAELLVPHDPEHPEFTPVIPDMLKAMIAKEGYGGYAVCSGDKNKYTADLRIAKVEVVEPLCPLCNNILNILCDA